jgi:transposase
MPQKWPAQKREALIAYIREGLSLRQAASRLGVSAATAVRWAHAAGVASRAVQRLAPQKRDALVAALHAGANPADAAAQYQVSRSTAARLAPPRKASREQARGALAAALSAGFSRRRAAAALGLSVATAIRWARDLDLDGVAPALPTPRRPRSPRYRPDRELKKAELFAAIKSGLSKRQAAAEVGLPVATAIRWASGAGPRET